MKKIITTFAAVSACIAGAAGYHLGYSKKFDRTKRYIIETNNKPLRVGVISDLQLPNRKEKGHQYKSLEKTLTMLKNKGMDALIIGGDFTDLSTVTAWKHFEEIYNNVMDECNKPIPIYIMGNHDYWLEYITYDRKKLKSYEIPSPPKLQRRFTKYTGEYPYSHKIINGYHFICVSSSNGTYNNSYKNKKWIRNEIEKAVKDDPGKPIFVITHLNPSFTFYGSDEWGNDDIYDVLKDYRQVVSISGHSHYSVIDERSIWQGGFTAFSAQSLDYIELESGKFNGSIPKDAYGNSIAEKLPACLYMQIESDKITVNRLEANTGNLLKEPWIINIPFTKNKNLSKYTDDRKAANEAPKLESDLKISVSEITDINSNKQKMLSFKAATDDDFVHSYKLEFQDRNHNILEFDEIDYDDHIVHYNRNGKKIPFENINYSKGKPKKIKQILYFSDFVLGLNNMSATAELRLPSNLPDDAEYVVITAIDSWNAESNSVICKLK